MTELREQLLTARDQYRCLRYPGDLASDVLPATRATAAGPEPRAWGVHAFVIRLAGFAFAAAAVVAVVFVRPPSQAATPGPLANQPHLAVERAAANGARRHDSQPWRFPPDLTFASTAAERVKTVASRVQMRMTRPYRDLKMPSMPEFPTFSLPDWPLGRDSEDGTQPPDDPGTPPPAGPSTQQAA